MFTSRGHSFTYRKLIDKIHNENSKRGKEGIVVKKVLFSYFEFVIFWTRTPVLIFSATHQLSRIIDPNKGRTGFWSFFFNFDFLTDQSCWNSYAVIKLGRLRCVLNFTYVCRVFVCVESRLQSLSSYPESNFLNHLAETNSLTEEFRRDGCESQKGKVRKTYLRGK